MAEDSNHKHEHSHSDQAPDNVRLEEIRIQLARIFKDLAYQVPLYLFTSDEQDSSFNQAAREILQTVTQISPRIPVHEYDLNHPAAKKWGVDRTPLSSSIPTSSA